MVTQLAHPETPILRTEIRGAMARLWRESEGEIVIAGPAGTGKTRGILDWIHQRCAQEKLRFLFVRKTLESLKASALVTYQEQVLYGFDGKRSVADGVNYFGGNTILPGKFTYEDTGSVIIVGGMDTVSKVLSTEYDGIFVNEATELTVEDWEQLGGRTDRPKLGPLRPASLLLGDCNPSAPTHWIKRRADEGRLHLWPTTHRDNPAMWDADRQEWTASGVRYLARLNQYTGVRRMRYLMGVWAAAEGQVYDAFRDDVHIVKRADVADVLRNAWYFGAVDWGWTSPGCAQVWAVDTDNRLYLVAEHYMTRKPVEGWWVPRAAELTDRYDVTEWVCDPSEPAYIAQFNAAGLNARGAINDIMPGITAVQHRLALAGDGRPRLFVLDDCLVERDEALVETNQPWCTVQEIPEYVWAKNAGGQTLKDKPVDAFNHGCFIAGTRVLTSQGWKPIETIRPGEYAVTPAGLRHVVDARMTDAAARVVRVNLDSGATLVGTPNHPVMVRGKGWVGLDSLRYDDIMEAWNPRPSSSTESRFAAIQNRGIGLIASISPRMHTFARQASADCTKKSGRPRTALSLMGTKSTIGTLIPQTTSRAIWHAWRLTSTRRSIDSVLQNARARPSTLLIWTLFGLLLQHGMHLMLAGNGTGKTLGTHGGSANPLIVRAISAARCLRRSHGERTIGFAPTLASRHGAGRRALTTLSAPAMPVEHRFSSIVTRTLKSVLVRVLSVSAEPDKHPVYNLTVEGAHVYFAEGVLVHNCDPARYAAAHLDLRGAGGEIDPLMLAAFADLPR